MGARLTTALQRRGLLPPAKQQQPPPLPLKKRQPRVSAELEAKARARELSPQELYWDPRYKSYFYAGTLPAVPQAAAARRDTATIGHQAATTAQQATTDVHASTSALNAEERMASILVRSRGSHRRSRARRRRRISFSVDTVDSRSLTSNPSRSRRIAHVCLATSGFATILLLWVLLVLWVSGYLDDYERSLTEGDGVETTARPTEPEDKTTTVKEDTDGHEKEARKDGRRARDFATTDTFTPLHHHDGTSLASHVCLYTHRDDVLYNRTPTASNETRSYHRRAWHCDVLIRCCYVLENDMTLRVETSRPGAEKPLDFTKQCGGVHRRPSTTLAAVVERKWALRKLLSPGNHRARSDFLRDTSSLARSKGYAGVRLWLSEADAFRMVKSSFVVKARWIATALRKANCTLGFFLPYPAAHPSPEWYATRLRILANVLKSSQSILLYPTTSVFRKRSRWPSPAKMAVVEKVAQVPPRRSVCYLLLSAAAVSVVSKSCDVSKVQRVSVARAFLTSRELHELCRSRNSSQKLSSHQYYSYLCGLGGNGFVFQTTQQARRFCGNLLDLSQSSCFGFIDGECRFQDACDHVPASLS